MNSALESRKQRFTHGQRVVFAAALIAISFSGCPCPPPQVPLFATSTPCSPPNSLDPIACKNTAPTCADNTKGNVWCNNEGDCAYRLEVNNPNCPCIDGQTQACATSDGSSGTQACGRAGSGTSWGTCTAPPAVVCKPDGLRQCVSDTAFAVCGGGQWGAAQSCDTGSTCTGLGNCSCKKDTCSATTGNVNGSYGALPAKCPAGGLDCQPCSVPPPTSCTASNQCAGFSCDNVTCTPLESRQNWTADFNSLPPVKNLANNFATCTAYWSWPIPQPPVRVPVQIQLIGTESNGCSAGGTTFVLQAACSSFMGGSNQCTNASCTQPCGGAPAHQDRMHVWDMNDLRDKKTWTLTCPPGDSVVLTHLAKGGCDSYNMQILDVSNSSFCM